MTFGGLLKSEVAEQEEKTYYKISGMLSGKACSFGIISVCFLNVE